MADWIDKVLMAYRPLYLRGLLMDGQYKLPTAPSKPPHSGKRLIELRPAFEPGRRRVLVATATAAAVGFCSQAALPATDETNHASGASSPTHTGKR
ncbi:hypothetical protein [Dyella acidiphila]|uniref:Uncharacterized protein n=1 Tax=Dyella acidiphila TaxID=2775866 RepID=A0ABR9GDJ9_9GAMM|nr:hypothetical protein [Dyella acidiphila]MBE1162080.1 hypothetical protein [Dyella acidiphila]